jgi:hypothetical protein
MRPPLQMPESTRDIAATATNIHRGIKTIADAVGALLVDAFR